MTSPGWNPGPDQDGANDAAAFPTRRQLGVFVAVLAVVAAAVLLTRFLSPQSEVAGGTSTTRELATLYDCPGGISDEPCPVSPSTSRMPTSTAIPTTTAAPTTTVPPGPLTTIPPGTYAVGEDIEPGRYRSAGGDGCYWATLNNISGTGDDVIANDLSDGGPQIVEIGEDVPYFETNDCAVWELG